MPPTTQLPLSEKQAAPTHYNWQSVTIRRTSQYDKPIYKEYTCAKQTHDQLFNNIDV